MMNLPHTIPVGSRIVARTYDGIDPLDQRMKFRDFIGHVRSWNGSQLEMIRDAAANGSRPEQTITLEADSIVTIRPIPERRLPKP